MKNTLQTGDGHYTRTQPPEHGLFETRPTSRQSPTSAAAAVRAAPRISAARLAVLRFIVSRGDHGATDEEGITGTGLSPNTYRPRRVELFQGYKSYPGGMIIGTGHRSTASGARANVYVATAAGRQLAESIT